MVSMGTTAARKSGWIVQNTLSVLADELLTCLLYTSDTLISRFLKFLNVKKFSVKRPTKIARSRIRIIIALLDKKLSLIHI